MTDQTSAAQPGHASDDQEPAGREEQAGLPEGGEPDTPASAAGPDDYQPV